MGTTIGREGLAQGVFVLSGEATVGIVASWSYVHRIASDPVRPKSLLDESAGENLVGRGGRERPAVADEAGDATWG